MKPTYDLRQKNESDHLKIIVRDEDEEIVEGLISFLMGNCRMDGYHSDFDTHEISFNGSFTQQIMDEDGCDQWTEIDIEVCSKNWRSNLLKFCTRFQIATLGVHYNFDATLQLSASELFFDDCLSAHLYIPLYAVHFGSLMKCTFISHFTRLAKSGTLEEQRLSLSTLKEMRGSAEDIQHPMIVNFEHDRDIFVVRFAVLDDEMRIRSGNTLKSVDSESMALQTNARRTSLGSVVSLKVRYASIRRVIVDLRVKPCSPNDNLRMYFHLNYPPEIRKQQKKFEDGGKCYEGNRWRSIPEDHGDKRDNCMAINDSPYICLQFSKGLNLDMVYCILSRLRMRTSLPIEFRNVEYSYLAINKYANLPVRIVGCDHRAWAGDNKAQKDVSDKNILNTDCRPYRPLFPRVDGECERKIKEFGVFGLEYLIAALLTRGAVVKDQILINDRMRDAFVNMVIERFKQNRELTLEALERLINMVDEKKQIPCIFTFFDKISRSLLGQRDVLEDISRENKREGYQRVRKVVITPTRMLLVVPELLMGNRVLRTFDKDGNSALRIQFRDDDGTQLRRNTTGPCLIQSTTYNTLAQGIYVGRRHFVYLGSSNSQMRDNGCYFFDDGEGGNASSIREQLGKFDSGNIPRMMSRMGQCFTQAKQCAVTLKRQKYNKTYDIIGGRDSAQQPYTFSDGVGKIAPEFATKISMDMGLGGCVPSCFQIRYRGIKGVLCVDPALDDRRKWAKDNKIVDNNETTNKINDIFIFFRPSQDKFKAPRDEFIEIVKYSCPTPVCLNRPMISILDQVSGMQGHAVHKRVTERIFDLLDHHMARLVEMLTSEERCRERLNEFPWKVNVSRLSLIRGFSLIQEPFFRSLLQANVRYVLKKQLAKEQIQIPPSLGRSMFGVMDETGQLQCGQVFLQYTKNIWQKFPPKNAAKVIHIGKVLLTKNPCIVAGDVRILEAVDIPELRHLVDVVVFPQHGPRPHPDEMAGSDLDGDEYSVIWDPDLMFQCNEAPRDYTKRIGESRIVKKEDVELEMRRFFVNYIKQDSIGSIANAFLVNADLYGITSQVCTNIARKHSQAVDFPKTGFPPEPLTRDCMDDGSGKLQPPERAERWPDYMCKNHEPSYISPRMVGQLYRRIRLLDDVLGVTLATEESLPIVVDPELTYPGWEEYQVLAEEQLSAYNTYIRALLDNYGIENEGQLLSGFITTVRNRISDRNVDGFSFFNTNHVIEKKVSAIFRAFRGTFFDEFGGIECNTQIDQEAIGRSNINSEDNRICIFPSEKMKKKASAFYIVCYQSASKASVKRLMSFAWIAWDVLCCIKQELRVGKESQAIQMLDPLSEFTSKFIADYTKENADLFNYEMEVLIRNWRGYCPLTAYFRRYHGLQNVLYVLIKWAEYHEVFNPRLYKEHFCLLFIQFGLGLFQRNAVSVRSNFLERTTDEMLEAPYEVIDLNKLIGGTGTCLLMFLKFLCSRTFKILKLIDFRNVGYYSLLLHGQQRQLYEAAVKTYFRIALTGKFDLTILVGTDCDGYELGGTVEAEPFMIELPMNVCDRENELCKIVKKYSGVKYLHMRRMPQKKDRVIISAVGTFKALRKLRELLSVRLTFDTVANCPKIENDLIGRLILDRLNRLRLKDGEEF